MGCYTGPRVSESTVRAFAVANSLDGVPSESETTGRQ